MQTQEEALLMIKGKRSKRPRHASPLSLTIATTSSTTADLSDVVSNNSYRVTPSPSNSAGEVYTADEEEEDMAKCLILLAKGQRSSPPRLAAAAAAEAYRCKTCDKSFVSFQALGGHRASHRKPNKPVNLEEKRPLKQDSDSTILSLQISNTTRVLLGSKCRVHECSICGAEFGSGQALGGHMRRHRPIPAASGGQGESSQGVKRPRNVLSLDLNLPAPEDHDHQSESKFPFSAKEQVIVFSASPSLIDCHY